VDKLTAYRAALRLQGGGKGGADVRPDFLKALNAGQPKPTPEPRKKAAKKYRIVR
jgi:hypothetical protein